FCRTPPQRPHLEAVVLVRDLARAVVELELLQRCQRSVPLLREREPPALELARLVEGVARRRGLAQERPGDRDDDEHREHAAEHECERHTGMAAYRSASFRCSTASGHMATSEPKTKMKPAAQTRFTSGFTSTFRSREPLFEMRSAIVYTSPRLRGSW